MKKLKKIGSILSWILIGILLFFNVYNLIDRFTGYGASFFGFRASVIVSHSMSYIDSSNDSYLKGRDDLKRIYKNDMIFTIDTKYDDLNIYDVVTYYDSGNLICHRIVDKYESDGKRYVVTRGDANNVNDQPFEESMLRGKVVGVWGKIGIVFSFITSLYFLLALFVCGFFICLGLFIANKDDSKKKKKDEPVTENVSDSIIIESKEDEIKQEESLKDTLIEKIDKNNKEKDKE